MGLTAWDDFPVHQAPEVIAHPGTSDRNFYDRYYFNLHPKDGDGSGRWFAIFGFGVYPNLGVVDAFIDVRLGDRQHVVRASKPLVDRSDLSVGPFRIEVVEPLKRLRFIVEETEHSVAMDATFEGTIEATLEPRQFIRSKGKVIFDTQRLAQTGRYHGRLRVGDETLELASESHWGNRDRSWGVRPVGEPETGGIRANDLVLPGMWNYFPMQFEDHAVLYICNERDDGSRPLVQSERIWNDASRAVEDWGPVAHEHQVEPGTRLITHSVLTFRQVGIEVTCTPLLANFISVGTGYGIDTDWRQGMYQGPDEVVHGLVLDVAEIRPIAQYGIIDHLARFEYDGHIGYGLLEQGFFGPFPRYGLMDGLMGAPGG